jgi:hypothetical protein
MAVALNGTDAFLKLAQRLVNAYPCSASIQVTGSTSVASQAAMLQGSSSSNRYCMGWFTNFGSDKNASAASVANGGSSATKTTTPDLSATVFGVLMCVWQSATSRKVYFRSNVESIDTTNIVDELSSHDQILVGVFQANGGANNFFLQGSVAELAVFNRALDDTDYDALAAGTLSETLSNCVASFPLRTATDLTSTNGLYTLTANGGVTTSGIAHPVTRNAGGGGPLTGGLTRSTLTQGRLAA